MQREPRARGVAVLGTVAVDAEVPDFLVDIRPLADPRAVIPRQLWRPGHSDASDVHIDLRSLTHLTIEHAECREPTSVRSYRGDQGLQTREAL
jgi:hypothetical protein